MIRKLDLRNDYEIRDDRRDARLDPEPCRLWPGCECWEQLSRGECREKMGMFFDDG
jgi:hypothetical protein